MINQKIGGVISTRMRWDRPRWWVFNASLLIWQLIFLAWGYRLNKVTRGTLRTLAGIEAFALIYYGLLSWSDIGIFTLIWFIGFTFYTVLGPEAKITLSEMIEAAQHCHVRLCIGTERGNCEVFQYISFSAPQIQIDYWTAGTIARSNGRFVYYDPNFELDDLQEFHLYNAAMDKCNDLRARFYDYLQILSFVAHLPLWMIYPPWWGRELFKTLNLPGGRTVCSPGVIDLLRGVLDAAVKLLKGYDTPMVPPCLIAISEHWSKG
jgi:hypothetical protein